MAMISAIVFLALGIGTGFVFIILAREMIGDIRASRDPNVKLRAQIWREIHHLEGRLSSLAAEISDRKWKLVQSGVSESEAERGVAALRKEQRELQEALTKQKHLLEELPEGPRVLPNLRSWNWIKVAIITVGAGVSSLLFLFASGATVFFP